METDWIIDIILGECSLPVAIDLSNAWLGNLVREPNILYGD